jgi:S-ribosylhomocysteine lyase LuxS involved in autoinducer biosynthesis
MKTYISGYYCRDDLHLQVMNKDSNRRILKVLKDAYPEALSVEELARKRILY